MTLTVKHPDIFARHAGFSNVCGCLGYDIGATSGAVEALKSATASGTDWWEANASMHTSVLDVCPGHTSKYHGS